MRRSFNTAVPVEQQAHPVEIRDALRQLIADFHPTELRSFRVVRHTPDWATITASLPTGSGETVVREVYFDEAV